VPSLPALRLTRRGRLFMAVVSVVVLGLGGWTLWSAAPATAPDDTPPTTTPTSSPTPTLATPTPSPTPTPPPAVARAVVDAGSRWLGDDPGAAVVAAAGALLDTAPVVVVAADDALVPARGVAWRLRAPLVPAGATGLADLLDDLGTRTVVTVARRATPSGSPSASPEPTTSAASPPPPEGASSPASPSASTTPVSTPAPAAREVEVPGDGREVVEVTVEGDRVDRSPLADVEVPDAPVGDDHPLVLVRAGDPARPLLDTVALAADVPLLPVDGELARDDHALARLRLDPDTPWAVAGTTESWEDTDPEVLAWDVRVARSGTELPGGGLRLFPGRRLVALYGSPGASSLGVLGEQPVGAAVDRARSHAAQYASLVDEPVVPTFEIITTVASAAPGPDGDYSRRVPFDRIEPWIEAAGEAGMYVVLDLQPGRTDFLTQARQVEPLLRHPHVGLALDPEWRLRPDQVHLRQIGSVGVEEVQAVADWLAGLTREAALPQKLFLLHQFRSSMLPGRERLRVPPELAGVIQMDGQGSQGAKDATWQAVTTLDPPPDVRFGWKNFYDEDTSLRTPADTLAVEPEPVLVSYQ
jgi:hypothetical protein